MREAEARHPYDPVDVRVQDGRLVLLVRLPERIAAEREPCVVEEDVDPAELRRRLPDERLRALAVGDVEREREVRVDPLHAARASDHARSRLAELAHGRSADPARRARDDRRLALEVHRTEPIHGCEVDHVAAAKRPPSGGV